MNMNMNILNVPAQDQLVVLGKACAFHDGNMYPSMLLTPKFSFVCNEILQQEVSSSVKKQQEQERAAMNAVAITREESSSNSSETGDDDDDDDEGSPVVDMEMDAEEEDGKDAEVDQSFQIKGCWTPEEDETLRNLVQSYGARKWSKIASFLPGRIGKQCRERWFNHLDSSVNHTRFCAREDLLVAQAHARLGNQWATISNMLMDAGFVGRTSNAVKNHWNSTLARVIRDLYARNVTPDMYTEDHFIYKCRRRRMPLDEIARAGKRRRVVKNNELKVEHVQVAIPFAKQMVAQSQSQMSRLIPAESVPKMQLCAPAPTVVKPSIAVSSPAVEVSAAAAPAPLRESMTRVASFSSLGCVSLSPLSLSQHNAKASPCTFLESANRMDSWPMNAFTGACDDSCSDLSVPFSEIDTPVTGCTMDLDGFLDTSSYSFSNDLFGVASLGSFSCDLSYLDNSNIVPAFLDY
eukprot:ANDGO_05350.mRNA.1 Transcription factor MYB44